MAINSQQAYISVDLLQSSIIYGLKEMQESIFISSSGDQSHSTSRNGAPLTFDMEYARWLEEQNVHMNDLRSAVNVYTSDAEVQSVINDVIAHYNDIFRLKANATKVDVLHILSGMWTTPAERCFLWLGGFRSSELLKILVKRIESLTEHQRASLRNLQDTSQQAEDTLSDGMDALQRSLAQTLSGSSGNVANYMGQMAMAIRKLGALEEFIHQGDNLRQQTLQQMHWILTTRQSAHALLAMHDYFTHLRALSSFWLARPR
ncbi:transcription factor TGA2.2-like [Impatiens glandulifera]|uniref:transcription factor TGA2.2-like n=1 Tax=Impatiens glandulifera TaxID=253017 RepID=UPI001FB0BB96|nr:transcription factor TGA2.2-like [Impatiens glandulifera]